MSPSLPDFQIFVKPVGPLCNLDCEYCYYLPKSETFVKNQHHHMHDDVLDIYIRQHIEASCESVIFFSWHGGEPLLAGIEFYRKALGMQRKYCPTGKTVINGIQTNGTLINVEWCRFLAHEHFSVGLSIDGPGNLHDLFRKTKNGKSVFRNVIQGYDLLVLHGIDPEILCVVHAGNVIYPLEVYRFFRQLGAPYITF